MQDEVEISLLIRNELAREGLRQILLSERFNVREGFDAANNRSAQASTRTRIVIMETLPGDDIVSSCQEAVQAHPGAKLVLLADEYQMNEVRLAFNHGVDAYILKDIACEPLVTSLKLVALGEKVLPSRMAHNLRREASAEGGGDWQEDAESAGLSEREVEVLRSLMVGHSNKGISRQLNVTEATAKVHVKAVLRKLKVANRTQAAVWAINHGFAEQGRGSATPVVDEDLDL